MAQNNACVCVAESAKQAASAAQAQEAAKTKMESDKASSKAAQEAAKESLNKLKEAQKVIAAKQKARAAAAAGGDGGGGGGGSTNIPRSPQLDLGFLGEGAGQTGFRSYVIASEVSNSQQANQRINDQASLVG